MNKEIVERELGEQIQHSQLPLHIYLNGRLDNLSAEQKHFKQLPN